MEISWDEIEVVYKKLKTDISSNNNLNFIKSFEEINFNLENSEKENAFDKLDYFIYNNYWTLRKCSSKLLDKLSFIYPRQILSILKPILENDLQCNNWIKK